jgi:hypothetical protein
MKIHKYKNIIYAFDFIKSNAYNSRNKISKLRGFYYM